MMTSLHVDDFTSRQLLCRRLHGFLLQLQRCSNGWSSSCPSAHVLNIGTSAGQQGHASLRHSEQLPVASWKDTPHNGSGFRPLFQFPSPSWFNSHPEPQHLQGPITSTNLSEQKETFLIIYISTQHYMIFKLGIMHTRVNHFFDLFMYIILMPLENEKYFFSKRRL